MSNYTAQIIETTLDNGLKVLLRESHAAPVASCYLWYRVGSRHERPGITGCSHWVEHMLFKGTPKFPKERLKREVERHGGVWNGFTNTDYTAYFENLPAAQLELGLEIEADRMQNSVFDPDEFEAERTVILSEREGGENHPQFLLYEQVQGMAYQAHPYRWGVIGWRSDLEAMTREDLYSYYRRHYVPNNATLVLVGDFDPAAVLPKVQQHFGDLPPGEPVAEPRTQEPPQRGERRVTVRRAGPVRLVFAAYHIPALGHADSVPLGVLSTILSAGRSSRLHRALVEGDLAVWAGFHAGGNKAPGLAWLQAQARDHVDHATLERALLEQIERVQQDGVEPKELEKAVNQTEAQFLYMQEGVSQQASRLGYYETLLSYTYLDTYLTAVHRVTAADLQRVAQTYLTADNRTVGWFVPSGS
jgi:zinc protease